MKKSLLVLVMAMMMTVPVMAQEEPTDGPPPGVAAAFGQVVRFLQLDDDQVSAWQALIETHRDDERVIQEQLGDIQAALDELLAADEPDAEAIGELVIERRQLGEDLRLVHQTYNEAFVALLDEAQSGRLEFIRRAERAQRFIPAFKLFELIR